MFVEKHLQSRGGRYDAHFFKWRVAMTSEERQKEAMRRKAQQVRANREIAERAQREREKQRREAAVRNARIQYGGGNR